MAQLAVQAEGVRAQSRSGPVEGSAQRIARSANFVLLPETGPGALRVLRAVRWGDAAERMPRLYQLSARPHPSELQA